MNSLYGRFGMDDNFVETMIIDKDEYADFENANSDYITDVQTLDDSLLVQYQADNSKTMIHGHLEIHNTSIPIASAITVEARIVMSKYKNNQALKLFYTDTDSLYTNLNPKQFESLFPGEVNSSELGKLKLENISIKAIFLAPKVYCLTTVTGEVITKVKGLSHSSTVSMEDFEHLLAKDSFIQKEQQKWFRNLTEGTIQILEQAYTIQQTDSKRELIYDSELQLIGTKPIKIMIESSNTPHTLLVSEKSNNF